MSTSFEKRRRWEKMSKDELARHQLGRLNSLLSSIIPANRFYAEKLADIKKPLESLDQLADLPHTFKDELTTAPHAGEFAANLTYPLEKYVRFHRTSGTRGKPLAVVDTAADWQWWTDTWQFVLDAAEVTANDRVLMAFSFGPFIGFWTAFEAAVSRNAMVIPGGGLNTLARLDLLHAHKVNAIFCTPSYALHMAEVAAENQIDTRASTVRSIIVAGEPGGSVPAVRKRIEQAWNASVVDHSGASEIGPWGYGDLQGKGLHVVESEFIPEFISVETGEPGGEGELSELVLTTLGRVGCPVIRYRTGDLVRPSWTDSGENRFVLLDGGVLGRSDDMMIIRGVNIFPSSVEQILRSFPEIVEYRIIVRRDGEMDSLSVEIEDRLEKPKRVANELKLRLGLRVDVHCLPIGKLPRFEGKGKRFVDQRKQSGN